MSVCLFLSIVFLILLGIFIIRREVYNKKAVFGIALCAAFYGAFTSANEYEKEPRAIDVYRGKTTLEITYQDSVAIDSTVVYKAR